VGKKDAYIDRLRRTLACQSSGTTAAINHNAFLTNPLEELAQKTTAHDDPKGFRRKAYLGAAATLKALTFRVTSLGDVEGLRGISRTGTSVEKIRELLERGTLQRLEEFRANPSRAACAELKTVWGLGDARANELVARGFWSVHQLRLALRSERAAAGAAGAAGACSVTLVPAAVERTLEVHEDLQLKIPRAQVPNPPCIVFFGGDRGFFFFSLWFDAIHQWFYFIFLFKPSVESVSFCSFQAFERASFPRAGGSDAIGRPGVRRRAAAGRTRPSGGQLPPRRSSVRRRGLPL